MFDLPHIKEILAHYTPIELTSTPHSAAVLVILLTHKEEIEIVITKRAANLPTYAGHYSFPGGMFEATDKNLLETAIRETEEELHLTKQDYNVIGQLNDFHDRYGNLVRPFVAVMAKQHFQKTHRIAVDEIDTLYLLPLNELKHLQDDPHLHHVTKRRPSFSYQAGDVFIWGLTAAILMDFYHLISR